MREFTKTEQRILRLLDDGEPHTRAEVFACLGDELARLAAIRNHICKLRAKLRPRGRDVICMLRGKSICYIQVRRLRPSSDE